MESWIFVQRIPGDNAARKCPTNTKTGGEHISRLVETPRGSFAYGKTGTTAL
ncbi:hypothetical protein [Selenomonas sp. AE3005]|uniref:hypothetical protein n=1 Tax=Selenomonas sp. AE3005 TaxID=1485543 RepID=UPI0025D8AB17|nr:hypothetical protein [Selenomonas sp. AE3005]